MGSANALPGSMLTKESAQSFVKLVGEAAYLALTGNTVRNAIRQTTGKDSTIAIVNVRRLIFKKRLGL